MKIIDRILHLGSDNKTAAPYEQNPEQAESLSDNLEHNVSLIKTMTGNSSDIVYRHLAAPIGDGLNVVVVYVNGLADANKINDDILKPLMQNGGGLTAPAGDPLTLLKNNLLSIGSIQEITNAQLLLSVLLSGHTVVMVQGCNRAVAAETSGWEHRSVEEPKSQSVIRGSKEGFTEDLTVNIALLRRRIKSPNLWLETKVIGKVTQTKVAVMYLKGVANDKIVTEILNRLSQIDTDSILEGGYIEEFIQDATFTPFPTIINTERPWQARQRDQQCYDNQSRTYQER